MYFLIASGLSLIYGLMGVLNFAHGLFLTVGAYALWFTESKLGGVPVLPRFLLAALVGARSSVQSFAALVELVFIRPLYGRHIEQVLVTVGLALSATALVIAIWGNDARLGRAARLDRRDDDLFGAHVPNDRWLEIRRPRFVVLFGLEAFLRRTRYGLIIRAGVENRAMVTALGIDVRKAFTLVFALGGVAAALAGVLSGLYFGDRRPEPRHVARDLRVHRRRHRRSRLASWHRRRGGRRRPRPAVRELLRVVGARRPRASCCCSRIVLLVRPRGFSGSFA